MKLAHCCEEFVAGLNPTSTYSPVICPTCKNMLVFDVSIIQYERIQDGQETGTFENLRKVVVVPRYQTFPALIYQEKFDIESACSRKEIEKFMLEHYLAKYPIYADTRYTNVTSVKTRGLKSIGQVRTLIVS